MIAALYVESDGVYFNHPDIDPWDEKRDARRYDGPYPVIAHPPCTRWGFASDGGPSAAPGKFTTGDDGGMFEHALSQIRKHGGILERPRGSKAWKRFGIPKPPLRGWLATNMHGTEWTCLVEQCHYGHKCHKPTWLIASGFIPRPLKWGPGKASHVISDLTLYSCRDDRKNGKKVPGKEGMLVLNPKEHATTPLQFRDLLISMVKEARL